MSNSLLKSILFVALIGALANVNTVFAQPVAIVTDLIGNPIVEWSGKSQEVNILDNLETGQAVTLGEQAELTLVYLDSGVEYKYSGVTSFVIGVDAPESVDGQPAQARELKSLEETGLKPAADNLKQAAIAFRNVGPVAQKIELIGPMNTRLMEDSPIFSWQPLAKNIAFNFALKNSYGETVFKTSLAQSQLQLPAELTLKRGRKYSWQLTATLDGESFAGSAEFHMASDGLIRQLESIRPAADAPFSEKLVYTLVLEQQGFVYAAQQNWLLLARERPGDSSMQSILKRL